MKDIQELRGVLGLLEASRRPVSITQYDPGEYPSYHTQIGVVEGVHSNSYSFKTYDGSWIRLIGNILEISFLGGGGVVYTSSEDDIDKI